MAVVIKSRTIIDKLRPLTDVSWSLFAIGEPLTIEIIFEAYTKLLFTANSPLQFGSIPTSNPFALANNSSRLTGLNVGDTIRVVNTTGVSVDETVTITSIINSNLIITDFDWVALLGGYGPIVTAEIYNLTPITGVAMPYNFIDNIESNNYISKVEGSYQRLSASGLDASVITPTTMIFDAPTTYQIGSATIEGLSWNTDNGAQTFKITHETVVTPFQFNNTIPSYFATSHCLKHVYQIEAYGVLSNPNSLQLGVCPLEVGNSGYYGEVFNGGLQDYTIANIVYSGGTSILLEGGAQSIEFDIISVAGHFTTLTALGLAFCKQPNQSSEYIGNGLTLDENFVFENSFGDTSGAAVVPDNVGSGYETIVDWTASITNVNTIHVIANLDIATDALLMLNNSVVPRFSFWVTLSNPTLTTAATQNKQAINIGITDFAINANASVSISNSLIKHYQDVSDLSSIAVDVVVSTFKEDECAVYSAISGQFNNLTNSIIPTNITPQIVAIKSDGTEFIIEEFVYNVGSPTYAGGVLFINYSNPRIFNIPITEVRKQIKIEVLTDGKMQVIYPFMIRWEYWVQLLTANTDFIDITEPNNGLNQDWFRYQNADWGVYFRLKFSGTKNNIPFSTSNQFLIEINDYESNAFYTTKDVETFTLAGASLFDAGNSRWYLQSAANTVVKATFVKVAALDINNVAVVFGLEIFEQGGIGGRVRYSSKWQTSNPLTWFIPLTGVSLNRVELTQPSADTIIAKAVIDFNLLPTNGAEFKIVARIYEYPDDAIFKITEDDIPKITEDDIQKIIE